MANVREAMRDRMTAAIKTYIEDNLDDMIGNAVDEYVETQDKEIQELFDEHAESLMETTFADVASDAVKEAVE